MAGIPKLIILSEQFRGRTFELTKDQHTVGRVDERDICIKDPTISTYHCRFIKNGNTYIVEDQGSTNGTRVNNVPIVSQTLQNSDILQIGGVEILYDCDDKSVTTTVQQQTTDIDVTAASTTQTIRRVDQMGFTKRTKGSNSQKVMIGLIVLLALLVLGLLAFLLITIQNPSGKNQIPVETAPATVETVVSPVSPAPAAPAAPAAAPATPAAAPAVPATPAAPAAPAAVPAQS